MPPHSDGSFFLLDVSLEPYTRFTMDLSPRHELGCYLCQGDVTLQSGAETPVGLGELAPGEIGVYANPAQEEGRGEPVTVKAGRHASRFLLFGGETQPEQRHLWWNFVSSERDTITKAVAAWEGWLAADCGGIFPELPGEEGGGGFPEPVQLPSQNATQLRRG